MKNILFVGGILDNNNIKMLEQNGFTVDYAANNFQRKFLKGFQKYNITILNIPFVNCNRIKKVQKFKNENKKYDFISVPYVYVPYIKNFFKLTSLKKYLREVNLDKFEVVIFYSLTSYFLNIAKLIKNNYKNIKIIFIIPDLPQYMNTSSKKNMLYRGLKKIDWFLIRRSLHVIDLCVPFTIDMYHDYLKKYIKNYYVVNGITANIHANAHYYNYLVDNFKNKIILAYTGTLNKQYGVEKMLEMMKYLNNKYLLLICGSGELSEKVKNETHHNIVYLNKLTYEQSLSVIKFADILINPRENTLLYDRYCFPSKLMDYISAKKKIIVFKSKAMTEEYDNIFYYFDDNLPYEMAKKVECVFQSDFTNRKYYLDKFCMQNNSESIADNIIKIIERS